MDMKNSKGKGYKDGGVVKKTGTIKPCAGCPTPKRCAAMGKCLKKGK
jgi:hypothetical protein